MAHKYPKLIPLQFKTVSLWHQSKIQWIMIVFIIEAITKLIMMQIKMEVKSITLVGKMLSKLTQLKCKMDKYLPNRMTQKDNKYKLI